MSPVKFHDDQERCLRINAREINGPRPSPLKISKDSHVIHKSHSSASFTQQQQQQRQPVIIYAHSPKVIHTQARDFMALVQKLTGFSPSDDNKTVHASPQKQPETSTMKKQLPILTDEKHDGGSRGGGADVTLSSVSPITKPLTNPFLADIPLFTPTGTDFFCSPKPLFPSVNPISPSVFEFMKGLPEY